MIKRMKINNFKCFSNAMFELGNLNLLAGSNGCGKSTMLQALLLLKQSEEQFNSLNKITTYGKYINLGLSNEILYDYAEETKEKISFELINDLGKKIDLQYQYIPEKTVLERIKENSMDYNSFLFENNFEFISAERISPQTVYSTIDQSNSLGIHGENALNFLEKYGESYEVDSVFWDDTHNKYLLYHVNSWLEKLFTGFRLYSNKISEADAVSLRYKEQSRDMLGNSHRPANIGFGITYVLPIIIALLKAKRNDLILIENPEAHLYPGAQKIIGELLTKASCTGAQIILETHSDHIFNGIRICAKKQLIDASKVKFFFFVREDVGSKYNVNIYSPTLNQDGDINVWPIGFFDEWDNALAELF